MTFSEAVRSGFQNYAVFKGARRGFWYWVLFTVIIGIIAGVVDNAMRNARLV